MRRNAPRSGRVKYLPYGCLKTYARGEIQGWLQDLPEKEVPEFLGREKSASKAVADEQFGYRADTPCWGP
ncbi:MAG: hypothetical protein NPIRA06_19960 [Nitrospirales bacterium]|nr:MAG: hypothetical protein NPIRA06_19960 [Nitrospirales bacterium]